MSLEEAASGVQEAIVDAVASRAEGCGSPSRYPAVGFGAVAAAAWAAGIRAVCLTTKRA